MKISGSIILAAMFVFAYPARALIVYDSANSTDNTFNASLPGNGAPWQYVAQVVNPDNSNGSAVYLGNGYLITASHVNIETGGSILLGGINYSVDFSTPFINVSNSDLSLFKIIDPPALAPMPLTTTSTGSADLNMASTMIGWGQGKGSVITNEGFTWGGWSTAVERWGTNVTLSAYSNGTSGQNTLVTAFNVSGSNNATVASASLGDSGSGLFQYINGTWTLAGVYYTTAQSGSSLYAGSSGPFSTNGADNSYAVEIEPYSALITSLIPEPGSITLLGLGAVALLRHVRRRRR